MAETVVGVFGSHAEAVHAVEDLRAEGFRPEQISLIAPDPREVEGFAEEQGVRIIQGGAVGVAAGGALGGVLAWFSATAGVLVPGIGFVVAAGPVAAALVGAVGGATVGGFIGMLVGLGFPESAAREYEREVHAGRTLVLVHPDGGHALAEAALGRAHALGIHRYADRIGAGPAPEGREAA